MQEKIVIKKTNRKCPLFISPRNCSGFWKENSARNVIYCWQAKYLFSCDMQSHILCIFRRWYIHSFTVNRNRRITHRRLMKYLTVKYVKSIKRGCKGADIPISWWKRNCNHEGVTSNKANGYRGPHLIKLNWHSRKLLSFDI